MQWEMLTAPEFARAVQETGTCVLALGVLERHGDHLPLGTDFLNAHKIACLAAEKEPAVVFPPFYFGQIYEAQCFPGTLTIRPTLLVELLLSVFDAIGRNGFRKIILYNGHGGNTHLVHFLAQTTLWEEKPYYIYVPTRLVDPEQEKKLYSILETKPGHAGELETSLIMANFPGLVKREAIPQKPALPLGRASHLPPMFAGISWYSNYPDHYAGDARAASEEKGRVILQLAVDALAKYIAAVKADQVLPTLTREFFQRQKEVSSLGKAE
ncbi:MAG: creatininase family protein [Anaerolineae bacterium]|nr:creatininase family protein [Anaerolineae bacterium]